MPENKTGAKSLATRKMENGKAHKGTEKEPRKHFDSYKECGCVDRWEAEGGLVVGEGQSETLVG